MDYGRQVQTLAMASFGVTSETSMSRSNYKWQRVLLKVSGEALAGDQAQNIDPKVRLSITVQALSYILSVNVFRGVVFFIIL